MSSNYPSIFNDVIGPVMRGPSSSHCAAACRIGLLARDLMDGRLDDVVIQYDLKGSLAPTHESQGSDMGLCGGLLGWQPDDERMIDSARYLEQAGVRLRIEIVNLAAGHPNTYKLILKNAAGSHEMIALSTGGGMVVVRAIDGVPLAIAGDYFETLVFAHSHGEATGKWLRSAADVDEVLVHNGSGRLVIIEARSQRRLDDEVCRRLKAREGVRAVRRLTPVLPSLSRKGLAVPFITCEEMLAYNRGKDLSLWELAARYESARGSVSTAAVFDCMRHLVRLMRKSVAQGLRGTAYQNRILGCQSGAYQTRLEGGQLLDAGLLNRMILYTTALMEVKSAMGVIVAAPTAGACAGLPGACLGAADDMGRSEDDMTQAMLAAGLIGVFICARSTFAAEVCGCQAECGSGSGMAAAALATLAHGTLSQTIAAASLALQNIIGMVCDPVAGRVEVPCLGKNVLAAANALACANMALADFDPVIPLDEVIGAMDQVGRSLPPELRCTALGGLSVTKTSREIEKRLAGKWKEE
jgi:L-serine dehydratase